MAKKINPEFQAAPFLGASSHDPIEQLRRHGQGKLDILKKRREEQEARTAAGLKNLLIEVKGWEDQKGFEEIMNDRQKIIDTFLEYSRQGMNLTTPKTAEEITLSKGLSQALARVQQKVDVWNQQKVKYDFYTKQMDQPGAEERIYMDETKTNIANVLNTKSILERGTMLDGLLALKPDVNAVAEYAKQNEGRVYKPPVISTSYYNPDTGQTETREETVDNESEQKLVLESRKEIYRTSPEEVKKGLKEIRRVNAKIDEKLGLDLLEDDEYYAQLFDYKYREKIIDKSLKSGGGFGLSIDFLGGKQGIGKLRQEPIYLGRETQRTFMNIYQFPIAKSVRFPLNNNVEMLINDEWEKYSGTGYLEGELQWYDPSSDSFLFRTTQASNDPYVPNNTTVLVPRDVLGSDADNLKIQTAEGIKTLKEKYGPLKKIKKNPFGSENFTWDIEPEKKKIYLPGKQ